MKSYKFYLNASYYFLTLSLSESMQAIEKEYYTISSIILAWASLESYLNSACDSLSHGTRLNETTRNFLQETELKVDDDGVIRQIKIRPSTTKKLIFILENFSKLDVKKFKKSERWNKLKIFEDLRDKIVHHREKTDFTIFPKKAEEYYVLTTEIINYLNQKLF